MRPLIILTVGYITGIIWGLYLRKSIVPILFLCLGGVILANKVKDKSEKIFKNKGYFIIAIIFAFISNTQVIKLENKFDKLYQGLSKINVTRSSYRQWKSRGIQNILYTKSRRNKWRYKI